MPCQALFSSERNILLSYNRGHLNIIFNLSLCLFRVQFEGEYQKQVDQHVRDLKNIGELRHNYEQMTQAIATQRATDFLDMKQHIVETIRDNDVYEREEGVRKILTQQINTLKDCKQQAGVQDKLVDAITHNVVEGRGRAGCLFGSCLLELAYEWLVAIYNFDVCRQEEGL